MPKLKPWRPRIAPSCDGLGDVHTRFHHGATCMEVACDLRYVAADYDWDKVIRGYLRRNESLCGSERAEGKRRREGRPPALPKHEAEMRVERLVVLATKLGASEDQLSQAHGNRLEVRRIQDEEEALPRRHGAARRSAPGRARRS